MRAVKPMLHLLQRNDLAAGVVMVDVDNFKAVNDAHGHLVGDEVLRGVAQRIKAATRAADVVARYGGEEFILFFSVPHPSAAGTLAEKLRAAVGDSPVQGHAVTISLGVACSHPGREVEEDLADLIADADAALLQAKAAGKDRVVITE
jgi:diguanylate cyclase (GGDEF)-like protein